ncbi:MAG: sterol-binding protein [Candidatus Ruthia sp.]|jgi:putative sterol carrier protein|nr:sterol-binding protein [Candidatus Ruthturnera sp.]
MKKLLITLFALFSINVFAGNAQNIADRFNASGTPAKLIESGWAGNDGGKGYKVLQVIVKGSNKVAELHIGINGKAIAAFDNIKTTELDADVDYKMTATAEDWADMGTGESGPMYHMSFGGLSFEGPMGEAMNNMGPFASFLINIGKNI